MRHTPIVVPLDGTEWFSWVFELLTRHLDVAVDESGVRLGWVCIMSLRVLIVGGKSIEGPKTLLISALRHGLESSCESLHYHKGCKG